MRMGFKSCLLPQNHPPDLNSNFPIFILDTPQQTNHISHQEKPVQYPKTQIPGFDRHPKPWDAANQE